jgi:hypothetical protein
MASNVRHGVIVLALLGGTALLPQIASAGSIQGRGDFGGTWTRIEPSDDERWHNAPIYVAPPYAYGPSYYEPDYYAPYDPGIAFGGPGIGVVIE